MQAFPIRGFNPCESLLRHTPEQISRFIRRMKKLNLNTIIIHYDYGWKRYQKLIIDECRNAGVNIILMTFGPRTFFSYSDWKPSYFAKNADGEPFTRRLECETYPCRFEPEALEAYAYGARMWLKSLPPEIKHVHMRAADGIMFCECPKCRQLPAHERWQPFVDIFTEAVMDVRSDLKFETDVYVKRYNIPQRRKAYHDMDFIMYDTFYRKPGHPIGFTKFDDVLCTSYAATEADPDAKSPNEYHLNRLKEWCSVFPQKTYIHENAMAQGYYGVFQHGTWSYLQDLELYRKLGVQGVCYEAYEPGYVHFSDMFETLARAMSGEEFEYQPTEAEKYLLTVDGSSAMSSFTPELIKKYTSGKMELQHALNYWHFGNDPKAETYRPFLEFALEHADTLDPLFIGYYGLFLSARGYNLKFDDLSDAAQDMASRRKLWDFMEDIPQHLDPYAVTRDIMYELLAKVR